MFGHHNGYQYRLMWLLALLAVPLVSAACFGFLPAPPPVQDESLVTGQPCLPPCWHGIHPGHTSVDEAIQIVQSLAFVESGSATRRSHDLPAGDEEEVDWKYRGATHPTHGGMLSVRNGVISRIRVFLPRAMRLSDVLATQGQPVQVSASRGMVQGEQSGYYLTFYYPEHGLMLTSIGYPLREGQVEVMLTGDILMYKAVYTPPVDIIGYFVDEGYGYDEEDARKVAQNFVLWPGLDEAIMIDPKN